jgi:hypothetical protein
MERKAWNAEILGQPMRGYQGACVLIAEGELNLFALLAQGDHTAADLAREVGGDDGEPVLTILLPLEDQFHLVRPVGV